MVRLGARIVVDDREVPVPAVGAPAPDYLKPGEAKPEAEVTQPLLRPRDHELALKVILPDHLARDLAEHPELAWPVKEDIARKLARRADRAFLHGVPAQNEPHGVAGTQGVGTQALPAGNDPDLLQTGREMIAHVRRAGAFFNAAGWVLHPTALAELIEHTTGDFQTRGAGEALDTRAELLSCDGADGGLFLGYPFIASDAAGDANDMVFSADWGEAYIGVDRDLVTVNISTHANFDNDQTVLRSVMHHDFLVRTPNAFIHTTPPD